ncbi:MAG TPA: hypothetical protein VK188_01255 [Holophaga sp.]|nr:hypothetical protein [Holophaga sp.]
MSKHSSLSEALMAVSECLRRWNGVMAERAELLQTFQTQLQPCMQPVKVDPRAR